ncbi:MAG: hypothetical protein HQ592_02975 [Planctomycetes bacterium]|nr:hypothetical protein [Planctomycetota bacterium]
MKALKAVGFGGPVVLEICYGRTNDDIVGHCKSAREYLVRMDREVTIHHATG